MDDTLTPPQERADQIGRAAVEASLRATMAEGALSHGWILAGPKGAGKATLAYRIARGLLDPSALQEPQSFEVSPEAKAFKLTASGAHPDLFVAQREWNEKTSKYKSDITIETIRALTLFLNRTAAFGGYRVAIIDTADDLNRNAANALLKALEEPPAKTLLLLLSEAPGRLIPTIRSRCRRIDLRAVEDDLVAAWLEQEGAAKGKEAKAIAENAGGRPGYALMLAAGEGGEAIALAHEFLRDNPNIAKITRALSGKNTDAKWRVFRDVVMDSLSQAARAIACGETPRASISASDPAAILRAWEQFSALSAQGEALNLDRAQLIAAMYYDLRETLSAA